MLDAPVSSDVAPPVGGGRSLLVNFVTMAVCFSVNHGTVSAVIGLATSLLGLGLGSTGLGILWSCYVLTAMIFATAILQAVGPRGGLLLGTLGYCCYVGSFLLAAAVAPSDAVFPEGALAEQACVSIQSLNTSANEMQPCQYTPPIGEQGRICSCATCPDTFSPMVTVKDGDERKLCASGTVRAISFSGSAIGGISAGFLWSAQGAYFSRNAHLFAEAGGVIPFSKTRQPASKEQATAFFSSVFAFLYLTFELVMRMLSSLTSIVPTKVLLALYCIASGASAAGMLLIMKLPPESPPTPKPLLQKVTAALDLLRTHRPLQLLAPTEMLFGFSAAMMNSYVNGSLVGCDDGCIGKDKIAWLGSVTVVCATASSSAAGWYTSHERGGLFRGKDPMMVGGNAAFLALGLFMVLVPASAFLVADDGSGTARAWAMLLPLYALQGLGRGIFESTNKAVLSDFCPAPRTEAGFANFVLLSGSSSTLMFFLIGQDVIKPSIKKPVLAVVVIACALLALLLYGPATRAHARASQAVGGIGGDSADATKLVGNKQGYTPPQVDPRLSQTAGSGVASK